MTTKTTKSSSDENNVTDQIVDSFDMYPLIRIAEEESPCANTPANPASEPVRAPRRSSLAGLRSALRPVVRRSADPSASPRSVRTSGTAQSAPSASASSMRRNVYAQHLNLALLIVLYSLAPAVSALKCFEQTEDGVVEVDNDAYKYCVLVPPMVKNGEIVVNGSQFGIEPETDSTSAYDAVFALSAESYQILTTCILERYEFPNPGGTPLREHMFRCVCNYDLCNREPTFVEFLSSLTKDSSGGYGGAETRRRPARSLRAERLALRRV